MTSRAEEIVTRLMPKNQDTEEPAVQTFDDAVEAMMGELLSTDDLDNIPALEPLIADVLFLDTLSRMYGESGSLKSFIALDFAGCVGTGKSWHGCEVRQGPVVYIVAEGAKGVRKRVRAWEQHYGVKMTGVRFLPRPVQVRSTEWDVLMEVCRRVQPALIIIDTQARVTVGVEENSATEMGIVLDRMEQLRASTEACVLVVHHAGYNGDHGRGSTSVKAALQTELGVSRKGKGIRDTRVTLKTGKQKDDEELGDVVFALEQIKLDGEAKEDGSPVTSVVLVPTEPQGPEPGSIADTVRKLDAAGIPADWGRDKVRTEAAKRSIVLPGNKVLSEAIRTRRNRTNDLSPDTPQNDLGTGQGKTDKPSVHGRGTGDNETAGQTRPGQPRTGEAAGQVTRPVPLSPPSRGGQDGTAPNGTDACTRCGTRLDPVFALESDICPPCATKPPACPDCGFDLDSMGHEARCGDQ